MSSTKEMSDEMPHGLDREPLDTYNAIEDHKQDGKLNLRTNGNGEKGKELKADRDPKILSIRHFSRRVRSKLQKKRKNESRVHNDQRTSDQTTLAPTLAPPAAEDVQDARFSGSVPEKPDHPSFKEIVSKPMETLKAVVHVQGGNDFAESLAKTDVSHGESVKLVQAHEKIAEEDTSYGRLLASQDFEKLKKSRQDSLVRWTMDRHVRHVRRSQVHRLPWRDKKDFVWKDDGVEKMHWKEYGNHLLLYNIEKYAGQYIGPSHEMPTPTESALIASFERVLLTSTPVQNFWVKVRRIYQWESPVETTAYMVLYFFLCVFNFVTRAAILVALCTTLKARYYPPTIGDLREKLERSEDAERTALDLSELIEQHGAHGWVDPLIEKAGPTILLQLEDLANLMEILKNFHEWRAPRRTAVTLAVLSLLWLMITLTPVWLLVKESFFAIGIMFFVLAPISNNSPKYRLLASPLTWLFWKIPTHGQWAIARLQAEATQQLKAMQGDSGKSPPTEPFIGPDREPPLITQPDPESQSPRPEPTRVGRYHCTSQNLHGNLCLTTEAVSFEMHLTANEKWHVRYDELKSMQKIVGSSTISSGEDLLFTDMNDVQYQVSGLKLRDEVFTQIIGYSGVQWQITT